MHWCPSEAGPWRTEPVYPHRRLTGSILQLKVWLKLVSPMVWRRVLVPNTCTLRELHGVIQVAMGWEGIHLYQFCLRAARYGSWELSASSPEVTLAACGCARAPGSPTSTT